MFLASEGVFEFSIGATDLGSVQLDSNWANNEVTPSDLVGVVSSNAAITIARIMQGLDADAILQNGISISQGARDHPEDLSALLDAMGTVQISNVVIGADSYTIPSREDARSHLVATRQCLFGGGYVGDYRANGDSDERGTVYYAVEPFADRVRRFGFTAGDMGVLESFENDEVQNVDVSRVTGTETIIFGEDGSGVVDALNFITPRLVDGTWNRVDGDVTVSGTHDLTAVAGNPGATRRIIGVQTPTDGDDAPAAGMYVLDYFANDNEANGGSFSGQYYEVVNTGTVSVSPLMLTIAADGGSWASVAMSGVTATLTLIGTRGESDMAITLQIARADENYGSFDGLFADPDTSKLSGTWCDIGGAVGSTVAPPPPARSNIPQRVTITWDAVPGATVYNLYRSTVSVGMYAPIATVTVADGVATLRYEDSPPAGSDYFYQLQACNSAGCSERPSGPPDPAAGGGDGNGGDGNGGAPPDDMDDGQCRVGQMLMAGESCDWKGYTFSVGADGRGSYAFITAGDAITARDTTINGVVITFVAERNGNVWEIQDLGTDSPAGSGNGGGTPPDDTPPPDDMDDGQCSVGDMLRAGESCEWKGHTFSVGADGRGSYSFFNAGTSIQQRGQINGVAITFVARNNGSGVWEIEELG